MTTTLLYNAMLLCLGQRDQIIDNGYLIIKDDRIAEIGSMNQLPANTFDEQIDCAERLVMPGLVNAHTHTPMTLFRGLAEGVSLFTLDGWYNTIRTLELVMTPDMVPAAVEIACGEMIRTGTTTFADQYFFMEQVIPSVRKSGLRGVLAYGVVELNDPVARERELAHLDAFLEEMQTETGSRIKGWVGPHAFFVDNSIETMLAERKLAQKYGAGVHIHLSTTGEEDEFCIAQFGKTAVQQMETLGMFDQPLIAAHSVTIPDQDWSLLAHRPFTAVTCAGASMRAGAEAAPVVGMRSAGINVAIGTDNVCNNNDYDLFIEMRTVSRLACYRERRPGALQAREVIEMATANGAKALGLQDEIGELSTGKKADLIMLDRSDIGWSPLPTNDPFTALVHSINGSHVTDAMVDGMWLMQNRQLNTVNYPEAVRQQAKDATELIRRRNITG